MRTMNPDDLLTPRSSRSTTPPSITASSMPTTLYPKITNHITEIIKVLNELQGEEGHPLQPLPIRGSVKLHGTHADILIHPCDRITFQSRNIVGLDSTKDNSGFAATMSSKRKALLRLRDVLLARYIQLHPNTCYDSNQPVLIAGEWIGEKIQKHVGISNLSRRFVIVSVMINGKWQKDSDFGGIALPNHGIYNISRAGVFEMTLYPEDPQRTIDELTPLAESVAAQCPFAKTFDIDGEGEGIVWKIACEDYYSNPALWFKTKGGRFRPTFARVPPPRQSPEAGERNREVAAEVAQVWCHEERMQQGLSYLAEFNVKANMKGLSKFLKWLQNDILVEEKAYITQHDVDASHLKIEIAKIAKPWYIAGIGQH